MTGSRANLRAESFSTDSLPQGDRIAFWREFFARKLLHLEWESISDGPFSASAHVQRMPGVGIYEVACSPYRASLTRALMRSDGGSLFLVSPSSRFVVTQRGRDVDLAHGDAALLTDCDVATVVSPEPVANRVNLVLSPARLRPMVRDLDSVLVRRIPADQPALALLRRYTQLLRRDLQAGPSTALEAAAAAHIYDLAALALGATRDHAELAQGRGLAATRLAAIKADIVERCHRSDFSMTAIARKHGVTPRYIRALFEREETTFSDFVRMCRLARAHHLLTTGIERPLPISEIAYSAGFSDLSNFNHAFRRHYGASPSEIRARSAQS